MGLDQVFYNIVWYTVMLVFLGWRCHELDGKGTDVGKRRKLKRKKTGKKEKGEKETKGAWKIKGRVNFTDCWPWGSFPEGTMSPGFWSTILSLIFHRHGSRPGGRSITMIATSDSKCALLLKCSSTRDTSVLRCAMSNRWPLILACFRRTQLVIICSITVMVLEGARTDWTRPDWSFSLRVYFFT